MPTVRAEQPGDAAAIRRVHERAFGRANEAVLVDALRDAGAHVVSLVAEDDDGAVVGHIVFSRVAVGDGGGGLGLGPVAVVPERQGLGLGSLLVRRGLAECRRYGHGVVVVLGHPGFYSRFGFVPASTRGLRSEYNAPDDAFLVVELVPGALGELRGLVRYPPPSRACDVTAPALGAAPVHLVPPHGQKLAPRLRAVHVEAAVGTEAALLLAHLGDPVAPDRAAARARIDAVEARSVEAEDAPLDLPGERRVAELLPHRGRDRQRLEGIDEPLRGAQSALG
jgi:putative acetyltransferase